MEGGREGSLKLFPANPLLCTVERLEEKYEGIKREKKELHDRNIEVLHRRPLDW